MGKDKIFKKFGTPADHSHRENLEEILRGGKRHKIWRLKCLFLD
jgi:hypothetical protein